MTAPLPSPAEQAVIDRFGMFDGENRAAAKALRDAAEDLPITPGLQYVAYDWLRQRADELDGPCSCVTTDPIRHCGDCGCCP